MEEKRTGGGKEFIFSLLWAVIFMILGQYIIFILPSYKIIGTIITILLFCILGFFVLTRYAAIFTYSIKDDIVRVNRAIGHRNKEVEFYISVQRVSLNLPKPILLPHSLARQVLTLPASTVKANSRTLKLLHGAQVKELRD